MLTALEHVDKFFVTELAKWPSSSNLSNELTKFCCVLVFVLQCVLQMLYKSFGISPRIRRYSSLIVLPQWRSGFFLSIRRTCFLSRLCLAGWSSAISAQDSHQILGRVCAGFPSRRLAKERNDLGRCSCVYGYGFHQGREF